MVQIRLACRVPDSVLRLDYRGQGLGQPQLPLVHQRQDIQRRAVIEHVIEIVGKQQGLVVPRLGEQSQRVVQADRDPQLPY